MSFVLTLPCVRVSQRAHHLVHSARVGVLGGGLWSRGSHPLPFDVRSGPHFTTEIEQGCRQTPSGGAKRSPVVAPSQLSSATG